MTELAEEIGVLLRAAGLTIAVAESCTGGLLGGRITAVPGSSDYFLGGLVAYSNEAKETLLHIESGVLEQVGAVSEKVAVEMATHVRLLLGSDVGIGITGIAGPTSYDSAKPIGLTYIALSAHHGGWCERHVFSQDREGNRGQSVVTALRMVRDYAKDKVT
jgi:nicotinamide-nucleotide amidase